MSKIARELIRLVRYNAPNDCTAAISIFSFARAIMDAAVTTDEVAIIPGAAVKYNFMIWIVALFI